MEVEMATLRQNRENSFEVALESIDSVEKTIEAFKAMAACFSEAQLGKQCFNVAEKLFVDFNAFDEALEYGTRALTSLTANNDEKTRDSCFRIVNVLRLLAITCYSLKMYEASLDHLNRANAELSELLVSDENNRSVLARLVDIQERLFAVKDAMGNREEAVVHLVKVLEIREKTMKKDCVEIGDANMAVSDAYLRAFDHQSALPFCLKALGIYEKIHGKDSLEVADVKRRLAAIYQYRGEYELSLEYNRSVVSILKEKTPGDPEILIAEVEGANTMIKMRRYEDAVEAMKSVVARDDIEGGLRVKSYLTMARALCCLRKFDEAKGYMSGPREMLEGKEIDDLVLVPVGFADLSSLYAEMNDMANAVSMLKSGLACSQLPQKLLVQLCEALMSLICKASKEKGEFPFMVDEVESLKETFGPEHCVIGFGYSNLGVAYLGSGETEKGAESLLNAKNILDATLGQHHLASLKIGHSLSVAYAALERDSEAIEIEEKVIEGLQGIGPSAQTLLKERVAESQASTSQPTDEEDLAAKISQAGISDE